jgi:hypothetical protein
MKLPRLGHPCLLGTSRLFPESAQVVAHWFLGLNLGTDWLENELFSGMRLRFRKPKELSIYLNL